MQRMKKNWSKAVTTEIEKRRLLKKLFRKKWSDLGDGLDWGWLEEGKKRTKWSKNDSQISGFGDQIMAEIMRDTRASLLVAKVISLVLNTSFLSLKVFHIIYFSSAVLLLLLSGSREWGILGGKCYFLIGS